MQKILVIDDEVLIIETLDRLLRTQGYEVTLCQTGRDAVERVRKTDFDLIITDVRMPDFNGIDTLSKIREVLKEKGSKRIPEICITGYADDETTQKAQRLGVSDYLYKPFDLKDFIGRVKRVLKPHEMEYFSYGQKEFVYKYVVMLTDTDQFKHMSFANYLKLMFLATDALTGPCLTPEFLSNIRLRLTSSRMQFKRQSAPGDVIIVKVNATEINSSSFSLLYTFLIESSAELVGLGRQMYELANLKTNVAEPISDQMRNMLFPIKVEESNLVYRY